MQTFINNQKGYNISEVVEIPQPCTGSDNIKSKRTIHVNTGKIYSSARIGAHETGQSYGAVRACCLKRGKMKSGDVWRFLEDYERLSDLEKASLLEVESINKPVICLEDKKVYESLGIAAKALNLNKGNISNCCLRKRWSVGGLHFLFLEDYKRTSEQEINFILMKHDGMKLMVNVESGEVYNGIGECALKNKVDRKSVYNHCHKVYGYQRFMFYEDYIGNDLK